MSERVLIVGAGPTGLMLGIELARHGVMPRVIDRRSQHATTSRALAVFARTLELLDRIGVVDEALAAGRRMRGGALHVGGRDPLLISADHLDSPFPFVLCLPQAETERILVRRAAALGVQIERGVAFERIHQSPDRPIAHLASASGATEPVACDWIVGCDGAHSMVREQAGITFAGVDLNQSFVFADAIASWALTSDRFHAFFTPEGVIAAVPLPDKGVWRVIASLPQGEAPPKSPSLSMIETLAQRRTKLSFTLRDARWVTGFEVRQRKVERYRAGRIFLAGDAAHVHSPVGGQGMNTGLQDAANLGWKLALVVTGRAERALLDTYHEEREPVARGLLRGTGLATRIATLANPFALAVRNAVARSLLGIDAIARLLMDTISEVRINYRHCRLSINDGPTASIRAGDRVPDMALDVDGSHEVRLIDLLRRPWFHLLIFAGDDPASARRFAASLESQVDVPVAVHVVETSTSVVAATRFGAKKPCAVLIRPDGYVGLRSQPLRADAIRRYLTRSVAGASD